MTLSSGSLTLLQGETLTLSADVADAGEGEGVWNWYADDSSVVRIDPVTHVLTAVGGGTARITAAYESDSTYGAAGITVTVIPIYTVTLYTQNDLLEANQEIALEGEPIILTLAGDAGEYILEELTAVTSSGEVEITKTGERTYTFQMPGENVTVNAIIRRLEYYSVVFKNWDGQLGSRE